MAATLTVTGTIKLWANETRSRAGAKSPCKYCFQPITWFLTVKNGANVAIDGYDPSPLQTERDTETNRTIEIHARADMHMWTCTARDQRPEAR